MPYLGVWVAILKGHFHISNQRSRICLIAKFGAEVKFFKFGTKNARFA